MGSINDIFKTAKDALVEVKVAEIKRVLEDALNQSREKIYELQEELHEKQKENQELEKKLEAFKINPKIKWSDDRVILEEEGGIGKFCPNCWGAEEKLIPVNVNDSNHGGIYYACSVCKVSFRPGVSRRGPTVRHY